MIHVLIVDDHKILRDGIAAILSGNDSIKIVGQCSDGEAVEAFLKNNQVDVILMDIKMERMGGIDTTIYLQRAFPDVKIIALSMHNEEAYISKMLKAGANGYILKNTDESELIFAIKTVFNGDNYFSEEVTKVMMTKYLKKTKKPKSLSGADIEDLTKREKEIIRLIASQFTNNEIGDKLFISPRTVDTHRRNLLQKLGVKNTAGLVRFAIENELAD